MQESSNKIERWKIILFHSFFVVLFVMAFVYYKERLYADSSYYIFHTIDLGFFAVAHQRIVLALSEMLPLLGLYLGAGLKTILILYSLGHVLFFYVLFLVCLYKFRDEGAAWMLILLQVVGTVWLYFSPMLEICYGAALLVIFYVLLKEKKFTPVRWILLIVLEIFILTSHPENFVLFFYVVIADIIKNGFNKKVHPVFFLVFIATLIFKSLTFSEYEGGKVNYMLDLHQNHLYENLFKSDYLSDLWKLFRDHFTELVVMFVFIVVAFFKRKSWKLFGLFSFSVFGLIILINATNYAHEFTRYNESLYNPLVPLITLTFITEVWIKMDAKWKNIIFIIFCLVIVNRMRLIAEQGNYLSLRTAQMENIISETHKIGVSKSIVRLQNAEKEKWGLNWSYPMEALLMSSLNSPDSSVSIATDEDWHERDTKVELTPDNFMLRRWEIRRANSMKRFFKIKHEGYLFLNTSNTDLMTAANFRGKVSIKADVKSIHGFNNRLYIPVQINNTSGNILYSSVGDSCFIVCKPLNTTQNSDAIENPLEVDVSSVYNQFVVCKAPDSKEKIGLLIQLKIRNEVVAEEEIKDVDIK